jgi:hypothetical protein
MTWLSRQNNHNLLARRTRPRSARIEVLEERTLMSVLKPQFDGTQSGHSVRTAMPVAELPMQPFQASSTFRPDKPIDAWKERVNAGDNLAVNIRETNGFKDLLKIEILGPAGQVVGQTGFSPSPNLFVTAKTTGPYTIAVIDRSPTPKERDSVTIEVFGINKDKPLPSAEAETGKRWAWLDGNVLSIAEPSGEGFQITSNWNESVQTDPATGMQYAVYTTAGPSTIKLSGSTDNPGDQSLSLTLDGPITVRTDPGIWGGHAGTVASTQFGSQPIPVVHASSSTGASQGHVTDELVHASVAAAGQAGSLTSVDANALFARFNEDYGLGITLPGTGFGMATGANLMARASFAGIPLRPDGTYFYYQKNSGGSVSFGGATATASGSETITVIIDPSDPFIYVAGGPIEFGASAKGLIPFEPESSSYTGPTFSGNLYGKINDLPIGNLPATASGSVVINLDPDDNGDVFNLNGNAATLFTKSGLNSALPNIAIGVNGTVAAGTSFGGVDFTLDVGHATFSYVSPGTDMQLVLKPEFQAFKIFGVPETLPIDQQESSSTLYRPGPSFWFPRIPVGTLPNSVLFAPQPVHRSGAFALAGNTSDPFEGTPLQGYFNKGPQFTASLSSSGDTLAQLNTNMKADFHANAGSLGGYNFGSIDFTANRSAVSFNAPVNVFLGRTQVSGNVNLRTGAFTATAVIGANQIWSFLPGSSKVNERSLTVSLTNTPNRTGRPSFSLYANITLGFQDTQHFEIPGWWIFPATDLGDWGVYGSAIGTIYIDPANSRYSGSVSASGGLILASRKVGGTVNAGLSNNAISLGATIDVSILGSYYVGFTLPL